MAERLNLGCGRDKRDGWVNVDVSAAVNPDQVLDLEDTPWPFDSNRFDVVEARHVLEHLEEVPWREIQRVLKPQGTFIFIYPIGHTRFEDPTHEQYWAWNTAEFLAGETKHGHELDLDLTLIESGFDGGVKGDPLTKLYVWYRLFLHGPGPWLGQVSGFAGERRAVYEYEP